MDESKVRAIVEAHGQAVVAGDLNRALADFTETGKAGAPPVVAELPSPVTSATVVSLETESEGRYVAHIRYGGDAKSTTVRSVWEEDSGTPKITAVSVAN